MGCWGWIKEAKKPSNPNLYLKIGARKVKRRKGFLEIGHSALTANFIDFQLAFKDVAIRFQPAIIEYNCQ